MLEEGAIPFTKTGRHRRIRFSDLMAFKQRRAEESQRAMEALAKQAQELGMGYDGWGVRLLSVFMFAFVLFPWALRDLLMWLGLSGLYRS